MGACCILRVFLFEALDIGMGLGWGIEFLSNQLIRHFCVCGHRNSIQTQTKLKRRFELGRNLCEFITCDFAFLIS